MGKRGVILGRQILFIFFILFSLQVFSKECIPASPKNRDQQLENFLSFNNVARWGQGRCRGHTLVGQKFFNLATFAKDYKPKVCLGDMYSFECRSFYTNLVKDVLYFDKYIVVPGFNNLFEFSSYYPVRNYLTWYIKRVSPNFSSVKLSKRDDRDQRNVEHFVIAMKKVRNGERPYIAIRGPFIGNHAVLGYKIVKRDELCVYDSNYSYKNLDRIKKCDRRMKVINDQVHFVYEDEETEAMWSVDLFHEDNERAQEYASIRQNTCY